MIRNTHIVLALISGALLVGYGGMDDSPGAGGIGLLTVVTSIIIGLQPLFKKKPADKS